MDWQKKIMCIDYHWCQKVGVKKELKNSDDKLKAVNINMVEENPMTAHSQPYSCVSESLLK